MKNWVKIVLVVALVVMLGLIGYIVYGYSKKLNENIKHPVVTMEIKDYGTVKMELYPEKAPNTVSNFVKLVENGYYDGLTFHRVVKDFMIQGGDSKGDGTGSVTLRALYPETTSENDKEYTIPGEFLLNDYSKNNLRFERGTLAMARADYSSLGSQELVTAGYNSAGAQFFITVANNSSLNGTYAAFGKVLEGMDIVDKIVVLETATEKDEESGEEKQTDKPVNPPVIEKMTVETYGVDYGNPETQDAFDYNSWLMQQYGSSLNLQ